MLIEGRSQPIPDFFHLQACQSSVSWLKALGQDEEATILMGEAYQAMKELCDVNSSLSMDTLLTQAELAAITGSEEVHALVRARLIYDDYSVGVATPQDKERFKTATAVMFRNLTVDLRDDAMRLRAGGKIGESEFLLSRAREYYELYEAALNDDLLFNGDKITDTVAEAIELENNRKGDGEPPLFFTQEVVKAGEDFLKYWAEIVEGKISIKGIDSKWLIILTGVPEVEQYFPQIKEVKDKLYEYVAKKHQLEPNNLKRLEFFRRSHPSLRVELEGVEKYEE